MWITDLRVGIVLVDLFFSLMLVKVKKKKIPERIVPINIKKYRKNSTYKYFTFTKYHRNTSSRGRYGTLCFSHTGRGYSKHFLNVQLTCQ